MNKDKVEKCLACEGFIAKYTLEEAKRDLEKTPDWKIIDDTKKIFREYNFKNFKQVMFFVNAVAYIAEEEKHHPDISLGFNYCKITLTTHAVDGLTPNDFILARKINQL